MIHPRAIEEFITRKRDRHAWMKKIKEKKLDRELRRLGFEASRPKIPHRKHGKVCLLLGIAYPAFAFWLDMGTGKTRISLDLINYHWKEIELALVLVPSESAVISWENEIKKWRIKRPFVSLFNSPSSEKWDTIMGLKRGIVIATYPGLVRMLTELKEVKLKNGQKRKKLLPDKKKQKLLAKRVTCLVMDEATKLANATRGKASLTYRLTYQLSKHAKFRWQLAGRPFGRDPTALWGQLQIVDRGETLGTTLGLYRAAFFKENNNFWGGSDYTFKASMKKELARILQHRSITYAASECIDLPKVITKLEEVVLPDEATAYYQQFVKQIRARYIGFSERKNAFIRMRQVSSGYVGFVDDESGEKAEIAFHVNPKLDRLIELIEEVPDDCKWVVMYEFTHSGRQIHEALKKLKIKHEWLWGGSKDARGIQNRFDEDENVKGMIVNHKKGAYALNLQRANYIFFFESPVPVIDREQAERRVNRQGQVRTVFQVDLVTRGTVDGRILAYHRQGGNLFKALIRNPDEALGKKVLSVYGRKSIRRREDRHARQRRQDFRRAA